MAAMTDTNGARAPLPDVDVLFFDGFDELDSIGPWEVLSAAGFPVRAAGFPGEAGTVRASNGLRVVTDGPLGDAPGLVIVPGGGYWDPGAGVRQQIADGALAARLLALHAAGTVLASVCTGAMLLSAAGLLRDRPAVTNKLALGLLARDGAQVRQEARVVDDGDIITAGGPMAGVDLAVRIVERYLGPDAALAAAGRLEHEQRGPVLVTARARAAV
jgi:transcriptional regulator GlxA family with amidase domain